MMATSWGGHKSPNFEIGSDSNRPCHDSLPYTHTLGESQKRLYIIHPQIHTHRDTYAFDDFNPSFVLPSQGEYEMVVYMRKELV